MGSRGRRRLIVGGTLTAIGLAAVTVGWVGRGWWLSPPLVATEEVRRGRFVREISAYGTLKAVHATPIVVPVEVQHPQKVAWLAGDGSDVKEGEPVVLFDPSEMEKMLADGRSDRETARQKITKTEAENRKSAASLTLDRDLARRELSGAESFPASDPDIFSRNEIITARIDRELLGKKAEAADRRIERTRTLGAAEIALNEIERSKADIVIRQAERGLGSLKVLAPHDGQIVLERNWRGQTTSVGDTVWAGEKIAELPDLRELEAKVYVLEADAGGLEPGRKATVMIEGRVGAEVAATVSRVDAIAKTREWRSPTKYFETILRLDRTDPAFMKPGQSVRARILLEDQTDVIAVPRGAIFEKDGKRVVYRQEGGRFSPVEVTIGRNSLSHVVVEKGLQPGQRIALRDPTRLATELPGGPGAAGVAARGRSGK